MEVEIDEKDLKAAGAESLPDGRLGLRIRGWEIQSSKRSILTSLQLQLYFSFFFLNFYIISNSIQLPFFLDAV